MQHYPYPFALLENERERLRKAALDVLRDMPGTGDRFLLIQREKLQNLAAALFPQNPESGGSCDHDGTVILNMGDHYEVTCNTCGYTLDDLEKEGY